MSDFDFESTSRQLATEQGNIHYHEAGKGPALLMIHGSGPGVSGWANFEGNLPFFAQHFRCLIIDLPGYGGSDPVEGNPVMECVSACIRLLDGLDIDKAHIIGNSLGGIVGGYLAAQHSDRVHRYVTIGGLGMNLFSPFPCEGLNLLTNFVEDPSREKIIAWLRSMVFDQSMVTEELINTRMERALEAKTLATSRMMYSRETQKAMAAAFRGPDATARIAHLGSITVPTLVTWGRDDRVTPVDMALLPMRLIPNAELHIFPNCGHWAMIERKQEFESVTLAFLQR